MSSLMRLLVPGKAPRGAPSELEESFREHRCRIARKYLRGSGIEIGALHSPLPVAPGVQVSYVDRMPVAELRRHYPELDHAPLTPVDVIDNGETLETVESESQDFVIANHFLEHAQDPIATLETQFRVLRPRGILFLTVPNRHHTFDRARPATTWEHLVRDHEEGPAVSYEEHLHEWATLVNHANGDTLPAMIDDLRRTKYSIHFHVWNDFEFRSIVQNICRYCELPATLDYFQAVECEIVCILRKWSRPRRRFMRLAGKRRVVSRASWLGRLLELG